MSLRGVGLSPCDDGSSLLCIDLLQLHGSKALLEFGSGAEAYTYVGDVGGSDGFGRFGGLGAHLHAEAAESAEAHAVALGQCGADDAFEGLEHSGDVDLRNGTHAFDAAGDFFDVNGLYASRLGEYKRCAC